MTYAESIDWLFSTQMFGIKLGLDGPRHLLKEYLAFPAKGVTVIHVAGTNGKGSTYPHLIDYRERIQVSGQQIPEEACAEGLTELRGICERLDTHPTFFEITLTLAMRWFRDRECELIILETGMGGRLDATTAVPADVAVITPIGLDHTQWLGETLEAVSAEKAAIIVPEKPVVSSPQEEAAHRVIEKEANERRAPLTFVTEPLLGYGIALPGEHQAWNAALAVEALHLAGIALSFDTIQYGLTAVHWPGRFEILEKNGVRIVLDGAHNPHSAEVLAATWKSCFPNTKPALIFSAVSSKDIAGILAPIAPLAFRIFLCPVDTPRATPVEEIAAALPEGAPPHEAFANFDAAFAAARATGSPILIAGSLFLIGEARARLTNGTFQSSTQ
jgi:dihydrofolate synthase/folylpolyglutamate synthase